ncbi:hypothetical protein MC885_019844, partial [Smutsia gigantea]
MPQMSMGPLHQKMPYYILIHLDLTKQQNNHVHGQPYIGPAAHPLNSYQKTGQQAQENYESHEVSLSQSNIQNLQGPVALDRRAAGNYRVNTTREKRNAFCQDEGAEK